MVVMKQLGHIFFLQSLLYSLLPSFTPPFLVRLKACLLHLMTGMDPNMQILPRNELLLSVLA